MKPHVICFLDSLGQACSGESEHRQSVSPFYYRRLQQTGVGDDAGNGCSHQRPSSKCQQNRDRHHWGERAGGPCSGFDQED